MFGGIKMKIIRDLLDELAQLNSWIKPLEKLPASLFFQPIKEGKWSTAEIISHITFWDIYIIEEILPFMKQDASIYSVDFEVINQKAAAYALSGVSKHILLDNQLRSRNYLIRLLKLKKEADFFATFILNGEAIDPYSKQPHNMFNYFWSFVWHDTHHKKQIELFLSENQVKLN